MLTVVDIRPVDPKVEGSSPFGLEDVFWQQDEKSKLVAKDEPDDGWESTISKLVAERTSPAVKAALDSLLNAPAPGNGKRTRKTGKRKTKAR